MNYKIACYIIHSATIDKFYVGITQDGVEGRLNSHNSATYGKHYTSQAHDWQIFVVIGCESVSQAMLIEKHIKKMKSRKYILDLKNYPEMVEKLKAKYQ